MPQSLTLEDLALSKQQLSNILQQKARPIFDPHETFLSKIEAIAIPQEEALQALVKKVQIVEKNRSLKTR